MNAAKQVTWFFLTLIILVGSGWYYSKSARIHLDRDALANSIESTVSHLKVRQFNTEGTLTNLLTTPKMQHIQSGDIYLLHSPHILVSQEEQPPWNIHSESARSFDGGKRITFTGNVVVHQKRGDTSQESTLKTEEVTYFPKEKKASTDLLVTYQQPGNIIQSTGMNAYLDEKRVELLHQARGSYVPAHG